MAQIDSIAVVKERELAETPLLLVECTFADGEVRRWCSHSVTYEGNAYEARVLRHNLFEIQSMSEQGLDQMPRLSLSLANADAAMSQLDDSKGFKGAQLLGRFVFFDLAAMTASPDSLVVFSGCCNAPEEVTDSELRVTALNRMNMARVSLPPVKIQRRCPWSFPSTAEHRTAALGDPNSPFYACGYSPDIANGCGRRGPGGALFASCGYTRADCVARGMFSHDAASSLVWSTNAGAQTITVADDVARVDDAINIGGGTDPKTGFQHLEEVRVSWKAGTGPYTVGLQRPLQWSHSAGEAVGRPTRRFGGIEFVPETIDVRPYGSPSYVKSAVMDPVARYNDHVPLVYGTEWVEPVITVLRNDGNLTRMEVLLSLGRIAGVKRVVVSGYEIPLGTPGRDMTGSGWYNLVTDGSPWGGFNLNFTDRQGNPQGDPYGSMAYLSIVVPNKINDGKAAPHVQVLLDGRLVETFAADGTSLGFHFTNNTAWVLLDLLKLARWPLSEIDTKSFAQAAAFCDEPIAATDNEGRQVETPRFRCNLVLRARRPAADAILGVRNNARLFFTYSTEGKLQAHVENCIALQQPDLPYGSNAAAPTAGGWPAYVFSDTNGTIVRRANGSSSVRVFRRTTADTPNRFTFEFQDEFNQYVQDSLAIDDIDDQASSGQEISQTLAVDGIPNFHQAARIAKFHLDKSVEGNTFVEFETSVKAVALQVGQIIALSYARAGWDNQLFRILKIAPQQNYRTIRITAQIHDDAWYSDSSDGIEAGANSSRHPRRNSRPPNPLIGVMPRPDGDMDWGLSEHPIIAADQTAMIELGAEFAVPCSQFRGAAGTPGMDPAATVLQSGGSIAGGQTLYYRITACDADGQESAPSFAARAVIPENENTNAVLLTGICLDGAAVSFQVYRGAEPAKMFLIAADVPAAASFLDTGVSAQAVPLPDPYFDHANFYWKRRVVGEMQADAWDASSIGSEAAMLTPDHYAGYLLRIVQGAGAGQVRRIVSHNETSFQITPEWIAMPGNGSVFHVEEPDWKFGSAAASSPARFSIPNQKGCTVLVQGRAADEHNSESTQELGVVTNWTIGGVGLGMSDSGTPPAPAFGISVPRDGTLMLAPPSFTELKNISTVSCLTYEVYCADELARVTTSLASPAGVSTADETLQVTSSDGFSKGDWVAAGIEILRIESIQDNVWTVSRAQKASTAQDHSHGEMIAKLVSKVYVFSLPPGFFFLAEAANWWGTAVLPCARIAAVDCFLTNRFGDSPRTSNNYLLFDADYGAQESLPGLRTNRGGQFVFQAAGALVIESDAASLPVHLDSSVRDLYAIVQRAPSGNAVTVSVKRNGELLHTLSIDAGRPFSNPVSGAQLPTLREGDRLSMDIDGIGSIEPGRDLTVVVRI